MCVKMYLHIICLKKKNSHTHHSTWSARTNSATNLLHCDFQDINTWERKY